MLTTHGVVPLSVCPACRLAFYRYRYEHPALVSIETDAVIEALLGRDCAWIADLAKADREVFFVVLKVFIRSCSLQSLLYGASRFCF